MSDDNTVWSDEYGDMRKKKKSAQSNAEVNVSELTLCFKRMTSGKGRTIIEITNLPSNTKWCKELAKDMKKALGIGGTYKSGAIELHGEKAREVQEYFTSKSLRWKKIGG